MLSATIFSFSHLFYYQKEDDQDESPEDKSPLEKEAERLTEAKTHGIQVVAMPLMCPACGEAFATTKKLNGHISSHKANSEWRPEKYNGWEGENKRRASILKKLELIEEDNEQASRIEIA